MFSNYFKLALRNMGKNRLYAAINIVGLAIGLAVFLFGSILASYERDHDSMFSQRDRIFTAGSVFGPDADIGVLETDSIYTAMTPHIENELEEIEAVARTVGREFLVSIGDGTDSYYHNISFADKSLTRIFEFDYLYGDATALDDPDGVILSESVAQKFFGRSDVLGEVLSLDHEHDLHVTAVIRDIAADSHFNSFLLSEREAMVFAPLVALEAMQDELFADNWGNLSMGDLTYMLLPEDRDRRWLQDQLNLVYQRHAPKDQQEFIPSVNVRPLVESNTMIWDAMGIPAIDTIRLLGLLVLIVACVNYTNLATAQNLGRAREVGLRKTFGAGQSQLLLQFLVESLTTALLSMLLAQGGATRLPGHRAIPGAHHSVGGFACRSLPGVPDYPFQPAGGPQEQHAQRQQRQTVSQRDDRHPVRHFNFHARLRAGDVLPESPGGEIQQYFPEVDGCGARPSECG
jgi:putative ABC transport system permease protein